MKVKEFINNALFDLFELEFTEAQTTRVFKVKLSKDNFNTLVEEIKTDYGSLGIEVTSEGELNFEKIIIPFVGTVELEIIENEFSIIKIN